MKHLIKFNESYTKQVDRYDGDKNKFIEISQYDILYNIDELFILNQDNMIFIGNSSVEDWMVVGVPILHLKEINKNFEEGVFSIDEFVVKTRKYAEIVDLFYVWGELTLSEIKQSKEHQSYLKKEKSKKFNL